MAKKKSIRQLDKELRALIQKLVRLKASKNGKCKCVTCGKIDSYKRMQGGHFLKSETYPKARFEEWNINVQCPKCNMWDEGNRIEYFLYMEKKHGRKKLDSLIEESKGSIKRPRDWYEDKILEYKEKVKKYESLQGKDTTD